MFDVFVCKLSARFQLGQEEEATDKEYCEGEQD